MAEPKIYGIIFSGVIDALIKKPSFDKTRDEFEVVVNIPGDPNKMTVKVKPEYWGGLKAFDDIRLKVKTYISAKGKTFYEQAEV